MKHTAFALIALLFAAASYGQSANHAKRIELAKAYHNFMFSNEPSKQVLKELRTNVPKELTASADFITQTILTDSKVLTKPYLTLPDDATLKHLYIIREVNYNMHEEEPGDNNTIIDSLDKATIPHYELVDAYYSLLFTAVSNKLQPFDLSKFDFNTNTLNLKDDTEKGIFYLSCMRLCGTSIWGYMNIPKPANTKEANNYIKKFPKFNGQPYYQYTDFNFPDFTMEIEDDKGPESYKAYHINKLYETLIYHIIAMGEQGASEEEKQKVLLGSVLRMNKYYKYTSYKDLLEQTFQEVKK